ncbi:hypothetical protein ACFY2Q_29280 [Micromonospora sp. NPDC000316]|uniref:hypothetical protein n=1 Tax=Micromonospora sp. NPDC000316 TaxID=3364216 RepID=UPI0036A982BF
MGSSESLDLSELNVDDLEYGNGTSGMESLAISPAMSVTDGPTSGRNCGSQGGTTGFCKPVGGSFSLGH